MTDTFSSFLRLWKRCCDVANSATLIMLQSSLAFLREWKRNTVLVCACAVAVSSVSLYIATSALAYNAYVIQYCSFALLDTTTNLITSKTGVCLDYSLAATPDGRHIYVNGGNKIAIIDTLTNQLTYPIYFDDDIYIDSIAISHDGTRLYAINVYGLVIIIDTSTNSIVKSFLLGFAPYISLPNNHSTIDFALTQDGSYAYLIHNDDATLISKIDLNAGAVVSTFSYQWPYYQGSKKYTSTWHAYSLALSPDGTCLYRWVSRQLSPFFDLSQHFVAVDLVGVWN